MKIDILNRFSGAVQFTCELDCPADALPSVKLGLAVKMAIKERANLSRANLREAKGADLAIAMTRILPDGDLIGWKKCRENVIVNLRIPEAAKRSHAFGRKCRAEFADVLEVIGAEFGISLHDGKTKYVAGARITPDSFDDNWMEECSHGVHFFTQRAEAEAYAG